MKNSNILDGAVSATQAPGFLSKLPQPIKNLMMTAGISAATLSGAQEGQSATLLPFTGSEQISGTEIYDGQNKSRNQISPKGSLGVLTEGRSRFTVTTPSAGTLVISWNGFVGTGTSFSKLGAGYANETFDVDQLIQWGLANGSMTTIATLGDNVTRTNDQFSGITATEGFSFLDQPQSVTLTLDAGGTYHFDNVVQSMNTSGAAQVENLTFSFTPIPESGTALLVGAALTGLTLLRRRDKNESTTHSANISAQ